MVKTKSLNVTILSFHHPVKKLTFSPQGENHHIENEKISFHQPVKKLTISPPGELGNIVKNTHFWQILADCGNFWQLLADCGNF